MVTIKNAPAKVEATQNPFAWGMPGAGFDAAVPGAPALSPPPAEWAKFVPQGARFQSPMAKPPRKSKPASDDPEGWVCTKGLWVVDVDCRVVGARCETQMRVCFPKIGSETFEQAKVRVEAKLREDQAKRQAEIAKCKARPEDWAKFVRDFKDGNCVIDEKGWHDHECQVKFPWNSLFDRAANRCVYSELKPNPFVQSGPQ